jgi:hypothetical protein
MSMCEVGRQAAIVSPAHSPHGGRRVTYIMIRALVCALPRLAPASRLVGAWPRSGWVFN